MNKIPSHSIASIFLVISLISVPLMVISRDAPVTFADSVYACPGEEVTLPIIVSDFISVSSISLRLDYNPLLMSYSYFSNVNTAFTGMLIVDNIVSDTLHKIMIVWTDVNPITLPDGEKLVDINFIYVSGTSTLIFNNTVNGGQDCEYADENGNPMNDLPISDFYYDGLVTSLFPVPIVYAGEDATIWDDEDYVLSDAIASDYVSLVWISSGTGVFNDSTFLHPTYTPGSDDIANGWVNLILSAQGFGTCSPVSDSMILFITTSLDGDVNEDGLVNVLDIITIVNYIMGGNPSPFNMEAADINQDGLINILDIISIVNIIMQP